MPDFMPQVEAARRAGVSRQVIGNWIKRGKLKAYSRYGVKLVKWADVEKLINKPVDSVNGM